MKYSVHAVAISVQKAHQILLVSLHHEFSTILPQFNADIYPLLFAENEQLIIFELACAVSDLLVRNLLINLVIFTAVSTLVANLLRDLGDLGDFYDNQKKKTRRNSPRKIKLA